jgi:endoglucanase
MIRRITPTGLLTVQMLGGWLDQALVDQRWIIIGSKGPVHAVTGIRDVHVVPPYGSSGLLGASSCSGMVHLATALTDTVWSMQSGQPIHSFL